MSLPEDIVVICGNILYVFGMDQWLVFVELIN